MKDSCFEEDLEVARLRNQIRKGRLCMQKEEAKNYENKHEKDLRF
jgi:hypothetical protein